MAGTITTGSVSRLLQEGVRDVFGNELKEHPPKWPKFFKEFSSTKAFEIAVQMEGFGLATEKNEGDDITFDSRRQGFTPKYIHTTFAKGYVVTREALEDELYNQLDEGARGLGRSMRQTKEVQGHSIYNDGFDSSSLMVDGDGVSLYNVAHPNGPSGGTYSNMLAVSATLSEAALESLTIQISEATDARGLKMDISPMMLGIPPALRFEAARILNSVLQNDTGNNAVNALKDENVVTKGFTVSPFFTSSTRWFLTTDAPNGNKYYTRRAVDFGQDNTFTSENARFKASERYSFGWDDARGTYASGN